MSRGRIVVVGLGPGAEEGATEEALRALEDCDVLAGYQTYINLVRERYPDKKVVTTPMRREEERCRLAFEEAEKGQNVAFICSGDPGVYGMAGLILEMSPDHPDVDVSVVPGVTAALSGAARLGAPLIHDFVLISLSDLLTPKALIEKRLRAAAEADFVIVLYNPMSHHRPEALKNACAVLKEKLPADRLCGVVRNIGRQDEKAVILTLGELAAYEADMFSTVFIGNSATRVIGGKLVTPRGYESERQ